MNSRSHTTQLHAVPGRAAWRWALAVLVVPAAVAAQAPAGWHSTLDASASTLFGVTSQTLASFATAVSHAGTDFTADASAKFNYGESKDANRVTFVSARSWALAASLDATPKGRWSPFLLGSVEASLEKRIARRLSGGAGAKWVFAQTPVATASLSVAALAEHITPLDDTTGQGGSTLARWSVRLKVEHKLAERLSISHLTFYAPQFKRLAGYTISSTSVGSFDMTKAVALTLTFVDNYDSEAAGRGAPTNNDGSLLFGVRGRF